MTGQGDNQLKSIVSRIEGLNEQIKGMRNDQKDILAEAKSAGWDVKALRRTIVLRGQDKAQRDELADLVDTYMHALGDA